jgi:predicted DNA-binding transcriptional regulator AlpA
VGHQAFQTYEKGQAEMLPPVTLLRKPQVLARLGIPKSSWDRGVRQGRYPRPIKIGQRAVAWTSTSIDALIESLSANAE